MILFEEKLVNTLREHCDRAAHRIWIASPFIGVADDIRSIIGDRWALKEIDCRILTDSEAGFIQDDTFNAFKKANIQIRSLLSLHAKIYIIDDWCLITSANLTGTAFSKRYEIGVNCEDQLDDVVDCFEKWWSMSSPFLELPEMAESSAYSYEMNTPGKFHSICKLPKPPQPKQKITFPITKSLQELIEWYTTKWDDFHVKPYNSKTETLEGYKWIAFEQAQKDFAHGVPDNIFGCKCFKAAWNLLSGSQYYPKGVGEILQKHYPAEIKACFQDLFDESVDLKVRISAFLRSMQELTDKVSANYPGEFNTEHPSSMQSIRSISVYLSMMYPDQYYLYKYDVYEDFLKRANLKKIKLGYKQEDKLLTYFAFCDSLCAEIQKNTELLKKCKATFGDNKYNLHLLTQDLMYCVSYHHDK